MYSLPRLNQKERGNMKRSIVKNKTESTESAQKELPTKRTRTDGFTGEFCTNIFCVWVCLTSAFKLLQKLKKKVMISKASITLIPKAEQTYTKSWTRQLPAVGI